ncbi:hypothetical protein FNT36_14400 [Hymenobacter setariae]|uniref:Uncharacterized protein n=1 Tax=Hymenobacter setariae TaxID=2594794 RepID=A0A558BVV3_9BACT|nr:hypothetical protein [Hymenobacter setariae]TVT40656.1 hypothetical protein FNT36_14400 [Hymenobacter setariae]
MTQLLTSPLAVQQLAVVLRAKRILHEAAEVAAGRLVAIRYIGPDGESYCLYPARVAAHARRLLGTPTLPGDGLALAFTTQGSTDTQHYEVEAVLNALLSLRAHQLAARRHTQRRLARNTAKIARLRAGREVASA